MADNACVAVFGSIWFLVVAAGLILGTVYLLASRLKPGKWGARAMIWGAAMVWGALLMPRLAESLSDWLFYVPLLGVTMGVFVLLGVRDGKWNPGKGR
jgi:hypothetical protein